MAVDQDVIQYMVAADVETIPARLDDLRYTALAPERLEQARRRTDLATRVWCAGSDDAARLQALDGLASGAEQSSQDVEGLRDMLLRQLGRDHRRLPASEMEHALRELGLLHADNDVLTSAERRGLERDGFVDLGCLLDPPQLERIRARVDAQIVAEGTEAGVEVSRMRGIGRVSGTVLKAMNFDGLFDVFFDHPRLLAAVRHVLGVHFKMSSSNYHCPLPGYGLQGLHADWGWGVVEPEVVNAIWMLDDFTDDNGPTRVVPGSHNLRAHPMGSALNDGTHDPHDRVAGEVYLTGRAGTCVVYNAHLWHGGTQNRSGGLRRSLHSYFTRSERRTQTDTPALLHESVHGRLSRAQRAILDVDQPANG